MAISNRGILNDENLITIDLTNNTGSALAVGQPMPYQGRIVISKGVVASLAEAPFFMRGQFELPKATGALAQGQVVFWDVADGNLNTDPTNPLAGRVRKAVDSGDATVIIELGEGMFEARDLVSIANDSGGDLAVGGVLPTAEGETYSRIYIASEAVDSTDTGKFYKDIVATLPKTTSEAMARGIIVNWNSSTGKLTTASTTAGHSVAGRIIVTANTVATTAIVDISDRG